MMRSQPDRSPVWIEETRSLQRSGDGCFLVEARDLYDELHGFGLAFVSARTVTQWRTSPLVGTQDTLKGASPGRVEAKLLEIIEHRRRRILVLLGVYP